MESCPYLGLKRDPHTISETPDRRNCCHRAWPVVPVNPEYQADYCLTAKYHYCPVYMARQSKPSALPIMDPVFKRFQIGRALFGIGLLAVVLIVLGGAAMAWSRPSDGSPQGDDRRFSFSGLVRSLLPGGSVQETREPSETPAAGLAPSAPATLQFLEVERIQTTPVILPTATAIMTPNPTMLVCNTPASWVPYALKPTDSLALLSIVYQVSQEELERANCLSEGGLVRPGDWIFVPPLPTPTFTPPPTETPPPTQAPPPPPVIVNPPPVFQPTARPTLAPPTNPPPPTQTLPPPPTNTIPSPTLAPPTQPPPTAAPPPPPATPTPPGSIPNPPTPAPPPVNPPPPPQP